MTRVLMQKHLGSLRPIDDIGREWLAGIKQGEIVAVEGKRARNLAHHRKFFALMSLVHDNLPEAQAARYPTVDSLVAAFKILAGIRTEIHLPGGIVGFIPGSISFAKMDQKAFETFFDRSCDVIAKHFIPGVSNADLRAELMQLTGMARAA